MGIKSQTHKGQGSNEIRMTDTNGMQEFFMHAQKDMNTVVENNETHKVLGPMRTVLVATGSEEKQIPQGNLTETIAEKRSTTATTVEVTTPAKDGGGGTQVYMAERGILLKVMDSSISLAPEGIRLEHKARDPDDRRRRDDQRHAYRPQQITRTKPAMHYAIHEGTFELPDAALDRTVNILMMNAGPGGLNLVIARGRLRDGENLDAFVAREWEVASRDARMLTEKARRPVTVGSRAGIQIDSTLERDGRLWHQVQTMFPSDDAGRVLVMTLTSAAPLTEEQQAIAERMLASFQPRAARPSLLGPGDAS